MEPKVRIVSQSGAPREGVPARIVRNPYEQPISTLLRRVASLSWNFPYVADIVQIIILLVVVAVLCFLYVTVGIAAQLGSLLIGLIDDARKEVRPGNFLESSGHVVAIGIYFLLLGPLWLLQLPFMLLGWIWESAFNGTSGADSDV